MSNKQRHSESILDQAVEKMKLVGTNEAMDHAADKYIKDCLCKNPDWHEQIEKLNQKNFHTGIKLVFKEKMEGMTYKNL